MRAGWDHWRDGTVRRQIDGGLLPAHTELSRRPDWVPAWASLPPAARRVYTRYMEAFASYLSHTDAQVGRLIRWLEGQGELDAAGWELYDLGSDPSECHDLAAAQPHRLRALVERWWAEAGRYQVLPLDNRPFSDLVFDRPSPVEGRRRYVYRPDRAPVPESVAVNVKNRRHAITAYVEADGPGPLAGVLAVQGSVLGGWSFHLLGDGRLCYVHNLAGWRLPAISIYELRDRRIVESTMHHLDTAALLTFLGRQP